MNEKREVILPSDFSGEKGKIVCYRISSYLELLYIDIRSRRIPEVQIQAYEADAFYYPRAQYHGMELILYPCPELDKELSLNGRNTKMSVELKRTVSGKRDTTYFKSRCKN